MAEEEKTEKRGRKPKSESVDIAEQNNVGSDDLGVQAMNLRGGEINKETLKILRKQPRVKITAPRLQGKNAPKHLDIGVNGSIFRLQRGKTVEVPASIAEAYYNSMDAGESPTPTE